MDTQSSIDSDEKVQKTNIQTGRDLIKSQIPSLPQKPGVYRMLDEGGNVLYVGKAVNLKKRVVSYTKPERISCLLYTSDAADE